MHLRKTEEVDLSMYGIQKQLPLTKVMSRNNRVTLATSNECHYFYNKQDKQIDSKVQTGTTLF